MVNVIPQDMLRLKDEDDFFEQKIVVAILIFFDSRVGLVIFNRNRFQIDLFSDDNYLSIRVLHREFTEPV